MDKMNMHVARMGGEVRSQLGRGSENDVNFDLNVKQSGKQIQMDIVYRQVLAILVINLWGP
jgi:hypothetical protein